MLCSFPSGNTGSSWLNRLRTAKGFPDNAASNLEDFLQNPLSSSSYGPTPCPDKLPAFDSNKYEDTKLFNLMSNVICDLFNFGDTCCCSTKVKRSSRKQVNPRVCAFSNNGNADVNNFDVDKAASRSGNSYVGVEEVKETNETKDEGDGRDVDLPGFSRTEVMVIDTSYEQWKFEKLLFRKKNVWKVRDNKGKAEILGSKKRRKSSGCEDNDGHPKSKQKVEGKDRNGEGCEPPLNEVYHRSNKLEDHGRTPEKVGKVLKMKQTDSNWRRKTRQLYS